MLVMHGLQRARADGCPAFLETGNPDNVAFYQSLGLQVVDEQQAPDGGPMIWFMQTPRLPGCSGQQILTSRAARVSGGRERLLRGARMAHAAVHAGCAEQAFPRLARTGAAPGQPGEAPREQP